MLRRPRARTGGARLRRVRGFRGATSSPFLRKPSGRHGLPSPLAVRMRSRTPPLPWYRFASARSRFFAHAALQSLTCVEAAAEAASRTPFRGCGLVVREKLRHSFNRFAPRKGVSFLPWAPSRLSRRPERGRAGKATAQKFWRRAGVAWRRECARNSHWDCLAKGIYLLSSRTPSSHSPVVLAKAAPVEFSFTFSLGQ